MVRTLNLLQLLSLLSVGVAVCLTVPLLVALLLGDGGLVPLALAMAAALGTGLVFGLSFRRPGREFSHREGLLFVVLAWLVAASLGALPFYFSPQFDSFTDAFFESMSGFTTTGSSVLTDIEALPGSLHFWRHFTHWIGGMGIILLGIAILPLIGVGGMELYRAEFSGARSDKVKPRIAETAKALWKIYVFITVALYIALRLAGMGRLDAACHTFSTMGTGGFSTRNGSIEAFGSPAIELILTVFMLLAGINFTLHYRLMVERRPSRFFRDVELRAYLFLAGLITLVIAAGLVHSGLSSYVDAARLAVFQTVSIMTTTGFNSADFELWPALAQFLLFTAMFLGGCTGSTAGGLKTARIVLLSRVVGREFRRLVSRRGVFAIRLNEGLVSENAVQSLLNLVYLAFLVFFGTSILLTAVGVDVLTAMTATSASMFNVGPGLGRVGPTDNYAHIPAFGKWVLSLCMLAGRLEYYTFLVLFAPVFWRK
ncbi:MAG: TrkH family potassium uptake protein [Acidobacteria bacterium]|nr:MAG: TrkH family potassium uptake protein [Acidobacteriota bacterium]